MATTVESPGIASAKEEAAAILFARQPQTPPVTVTAPILETAKTVHAQPARPQFASYHEPEPMPTRPTVVDTSAFRPYQNFDEVKVVSAEPQVVRPYIDSSDYLSSAVAATSVTAPEPVAPVAPVVERPATVTVVSSALDTELEEDTQYVVKFKNSTIVAATIIATIFLLLSVLVVVNIVNLVTASAEVNALWQESTALNQTLNEEQAKLDQIRQEVEASGGSGDRTVQYETYVESGNSTTSNTSVNNSFFDWLCHSLSQLFG